MIGAANASFANAVGADAAWHTVAQAVTLKAYGWGSRAQEIHYRFDSVAAQAIYHEQLGTIIELPYGVRNDFSLRLRDHVHLGKYNGIRLGKHRPQLLRCATARCAFQDTDAQRLLSSWATAMAQTSGLYEQQVAIHSRRPAPEFWQFAYEIVIGADVLAQTHHAGHIQRTITNVILSVQAVDLSDAWLEPPVLKKGKRRLEKGSLSNSCTAADHHHVEHEHPFTKIC